MKRTFIISAIAFIAMASCQKESTQEKPVVEPLVFTASIDGSATKTTVDTTGADKGKVYWDEIDTITITDAASNTAVYQVSGGAETSTATFTKKSGADLTTPPYTAIFGKMDTVQTYTTGDVKNLPMSATSQTTSLTFKVTCGLLRVNLTDASNSIKRIEVTGTPVDASASSTFSLTFTEAQSITTARDFYITLPAGTYKEFAFVNSENRASVKSNSTGLTIDTNKVSSIKFASLPAFNWLPGKFSINDTTKVRFSKGNLHTKRTSSSSSDWIWGFYDHQYDWNSLNSKTPTRTATANDIEIDLFCWGYDATGSLNPIENASHSSFTDWGITIDSKGTWRTLSGDDVGEWNYLIFTRTVTVGGVKKTSYGEGTVEGVKGLIILPDNWDGSVCSSFTYGASEWSNTFSSSTTPTWSAMEEAGCVFLPSAGFRENGTNIQTLGLSGAYWSSSVKLMSTPYDIDFSRNSIGRWTHNRNYGMSVRLVSVIK